MPNQPQILIVDDEASSREPILRALALAGYSVRESDHAETALKMIHDQLPDVALIDYRMPGVDGLEMIKRLRNDPEPAIAEIPVIVMTGYGETEVPSLEAGADDFITKPVDLAVLRARIATQMRLASMRRELHRQKEEAEARSREFERDLDAARLTQQSLIPQKTPTIPGWSIATAYRPVLQVGGDIYGWLPTKEGRWLFWIADAPGHGAAAALLTTLAKLLFHHAIVENDSPCEIMQKMNQDFHGILRGHSFMTAMAVLLDPATGRASVCGAGHPPLLVTRFGRGTETIPASMPPLGLAKTKAEATVLEIARGDAFVLYTDGLFGGEKTEGPPSTPVQLAAAINPFASDADMLLAGLLEFSDQRVPEEEPKDDVAVVVVQRQT
jgi:sigma-B regulation protein RsbU (phosphoserine phosphatase)